MSAGDHIVADGQTGLAVMALFEHLRQTEVMLLERPRDPDRELSSAAAIVISKGDIEDLVSACASLHAMAVKAVALAGALPNSEIELRLQLMGTAAESELAGGVKDVDRVLLLASCLSVKRGFQALSDALRCTDCHRDWGSTTLADVLKRFRASDGFFVRRVTERAKLSPNASWAGCDREQIAALARVLADHAETDRCRGAR